MEDNRYCASIDFEDKALTTKVTFSMRCNGTTDAASHKGSLSFKDVYLEVEYIPPCSEWELNETEVTLNAGALFSGRIIINEANKTFSHRLNVKLGDTSQDHDFPAVGIDNSITEFAFSRLLPDYWNYAIPIDKDRAVATFTLTTLSDGVALGSDTKQMTFIISDDAAPYFDMDPFEIEFERTYTLSGQTTFIANKSRCIASAYGLNGDQYKSNIQKIEWKTDIGAISVLNELMDDGSLTPIDGMRAVYRTEPVDISSILAAGINHIHIVITDSRGRQSSVRNDYELDVKEYYDIQISTVKQGRIDGDSGVAGKDAWYAQCFFSCTH